MHKIIPEIFKGLRIDVVVSKLIPNFSRTQLTAFIKNGNITVNQQRVKPKDKVIGGEELLIEIPLEPPISYINEPQPIPLNIAYEDEDLLVINKPANLVVHPGAGNYNNTLVNALLYYNPALGILPRAGIIHRLDKDTTGLLLVAKNNETKHALTSLLQLRQIKRCYTALVYGKITARNEIKTAFGRDPKHRIKMAVRPQGKEAITRYAPQTIFRDFSVIDIEILTGRTHQIRVHMSYIKHPIVGDPLYGKHRPAATIPTAIQTAITHFKRQALHAKSLTFIHPRTQKTLTITAPLPDDLISLIALISQENDPYLSSVDSPF